MEMAPAMFKQNDTTNKKIRSLIHYHEARQSEGIAANAAILPSQCPALETRIQIAPRRHLPGLVNPKQGAAE